MSTVEKLADSTLENEEERNTIFVRSASCSPAMPSGLTAKLCTPTLAGQEENLLLPQVRLITVALNSFLEDPSRFFEVIPGERYTFLLERIEDQQTTPELRREDICREELYVLCVQLACLAENPEALVVTIGEV